MPRYLDFCWEKVDNDEQTDEQTGVLARKRETTGAETTGAETVSVLRKQSKPHRDERRVTRRFFVYGRVFELQCHHWQTSRDIPSIERLPALLQPGRRHRGVEHEGEL